MTTPQAANDLWDAFLEKFPFEGLAHLTLEQYTQSRNPECFTFGWLEQKTELLGSIWGGSAFKFGIYSRRNVEEKTGGNGRTYADGYAWYTKYGITAEQAFLRVRQIICEVASAARRGDLEFIQRADLGTAIKWKIAFLYQDRAFPSIVPVYSASHLAAFVEGNSRAGMAHLQQAAMGRRGTLDVVEFGQKVWADAEALLAATVLTPEETLAYFRDNPDRFSAVREPSVKMVGFVTGEGRNIGLIIDGKETRLWVEPGSWLDEVRGHLGSVESYPAERTRHSGLAAHAPGLTQGHPALLITVPDMGTLIAFCNAYDEAGILTEETMQEQFTMQVEGPMPLNQILFGPPGTGKTYTTISEAVRILDPGFYREKQANRDALKRRFDELLVLDRVRFVTFHQSFSYEDFVEGLRATTNDEKQLEYLVEPGVFKRICDDARAQGVQPDAGVPNNPRIWKVSVNGTGPSATKTYCLSHGEVRIGWGDAGDLTADQTNDYHATLGSGDKGTLRYFSEEMAQGDIVLCIKSAAAVEAIGVVTGAYRYETVTPDGVRDDYRHVRSVRWLYQGLDVPIAPLNDGKQFTLKTVYAIDRFSWGDLLAYLGQVGAIPVPRTLAAASHVPYVLIIDEINRGNVSRIFGELITLIESSKRTGADEALSVTLPYSKRPFSVPSNVYLIGTMNTADRSLTGLDIALRRRFTFRELTPQYKELDNVAVEGINLGKMLRVMNERIEVLLDREHCVGHAYFMPLIKQRDFNRLQAIFRGQIFPLLQEYFFENWDRIAWVLNDQNKTADVSFIRMTSTDLSALFGMKTGANLRSANQRWEINETAFANINSYLQIIGSPE